MSFFWPASGVGKPACVVPWQPRKPGTKELESKRDRFKAGLEAGVTIVNVSDIGVFARGNGARGLEVLVDFEMTPVQARRAAKVVAAKARHLEETIRAVKGGLHADLVAVEADPTKEIEALCNVKLAVKGGTPYKQP